MVVPCGEVGGGLGAVAPAVGLEGAQQESGESPTTSISSSSSWRWWCSWRSCQGYVFHFLAIRQRGIVVQPDTSAAPGCGPGTFITRSTSPQGEGNI